MLAEDLARPIEPSPGEGSRRVHRRRLSETPPVKASEGPPA